MKNTKYTFKAFYYDGSTRTISVRVSKERYAYDRARKMAIKKLNDLDFIELYSTSL